MAGSSGLPRRNATVGAIESAGKPRLPYQSRWSVSAKYSLMAYTYIIESLSTGKWYYGSTDDLAERLLYPNNGWNRSTKGRGPWKYIFIREFPRSEQAREFEFHLKRLRRKDYILIKYREYFLTAEQ